MVELRALEPPAFVTDELVPDGTPPALPDFSVDWVPPLERAEPPLEECVPPLLESVAPPFDALLVVVDALVVVVPLEPPLAVLGALDCSCSPPEPSGDRAVDLVAPPEFEPPVLALPPGDPGPFTSEPQAMQRARQGRARVTANDCIVLLSLAQSSQRAPPQRTGCTGFGAQLPSKMVQLSKVVS